MGKIKFYNCTKYGHYSANGEQQKKIRCAKCYRTSHKTATAKQDEKTNVNKFVINNSKSNETLILTVKIIVVQAEAFIDPGSAYSLIKKTCADNVNQKFKCNELLKGLALEEFYSID